ncbi:hypothetical protein NFC73_11250 [Pseudarthrobacter sp. RMG13]|uniref:Uncharacterized protein n=1 Tax=Pseudarthrobacter humi TaxID=2952523 RepID=A0ABT1LQZ0_9MICC|nr:hypothetical protein [Pseudarthrobacter humi]MCP9000299.1 hypothetical protein [Pseudarthrobacter humi]
MQDHPQIRAFTEAALSLRAERYWDYGSRDERVEFLRALGELLTEVWYHLDVNDVLPPNVVEVCHDVAAPAIRILPVGPSAELLLLTYLDRRIEQLIAAPDDSRHTGAEGVNPADRAAGP